MVYLIGLNGLEMMENCHRLDLSLVSYRRDGGAYLWEYHRRIIRLLFGVMESTRSDLLEDHLYLHHLPSCWSDLSCSVSTTIGCTVMAEGVVRWWQFTGEHQGTAVVNDSRVEMGAVSPTFVV